MGDGMVLKKNLAPWDRWIRLVLAAVLVLGSPLLVRGTLWLTILGAIGGMQLFAAISGY